MPYKTKGNRLVNEVTLGDGYPLSSNLKPLKVGGKTSPLEMATAYPDDSVDAKVKVVGDLEVTGTTNIDTVGALNSGSITSGFTSIDVGSGAITTTGTLTGGNGVCGGGRFQVQGQFEVYGRYGSVNTWYTGNQSYGTSIAVADWSAGGQKYTYAQFTASAQVKLQSWTFNGSFSTAKDYEMEMWHVEAPANGEADAEEATKVGDTQSVTAAASRLYVLGETGLSYTIPAGDQLYLLSRYTDGGGTVYQYGTVGMEFKNG